METSLVASRLQQAQVCHLLLVLLLIARAIMSYDEL